MKYTPQHAAQAVDILERLLPAVEPKPEYFELVAVLKSPHRWKEAHGLFSKIRVNITLPSESHKQETLNDCFVYVAENAAKTAYNCSGESAPFDNDSFQRLLKCEEDFLKKLNTRG